LALKRKDNNNLEKKYMENNFALQKQTGNFMARANSAVGMFKVFSSLCKRLTVWFPSSWVGG